MSPLRRSPLFLALTLAVGFTAFASSASRAADAPPRLVQVTLSGTATLSQLLEAGLDIVEVHGGNVVLLEWPGDEATIARLGVATELLDANPGATAARRSAAEFAARPRITRAAAPIHAARAQTAPPFGSGTMGGFWTGPEIKQKLDDLVANDVNDVVADQVDSIGTTRQGRPVWGLRLGKRVAGPDTRPVVLYNSLTHAREPEGMQALFYFVDDLLAKYGTDPFATSLLDHRVIYIVPLVNPDGYQINLNNYLSNGGLSFGLWRKNARDNDANGTINSNDGVDLNRNFGYQWGLNSQGSSGTPSSDTYRGPSAFSEPETKAQRDLVVALKPKTGLSFHTYSDLMLHPWGYTPAGAPDSAAFQEWTDAASLGDGYQTGPSPRVLYSVNGEFNDWAYGDTLLKPRAYTWTPEVGNSDDGFWPAPSRIVPIAAQNLRRCYTVAAIAGDYVRIDNAVFSEGALNIGALGHLAIRARNIGLASTGAGLQATLVSLDPGAEVLSDPIGYPTLGSRQSGDATGGATFLVATVDTLTPGRLLRFRVDFTTPAGSFSSDTVEVPAGTPTLLFADNATSGLGAWTATGAWGIQAGNAAHAGGFFSDSPAGFYVNNANTTFRLTTPLNLSTGVHAYASFGSRWDLETSYDASRVEASLDGTNWTALYGRGSALDGASSQPAPPFYSGTRQRWTRERVDLSPFAGPTSTAVSYRHHLIADAGANFDGFTFDSLRIEIYDPAAQPVPVAVGSGPAPARLAFAAPSPNPARGAVTFAFDLPHAGAVHLDVYDLAGRHLSTVASGTLPAQRYVHGWDLRDGSGRTVAPGVYLARLGTADGALVRRFVVVR